MERAAPQASGHSSAVCTLTARPRPILCSLPPSDCQASAQPYRIPPEGEVLGPPLLHLSTGPWLQVGDSAVLSRLEEYQVPLSVQRSHLQDLLQLDVEAEPVTGVCPGGLRTSVPCVAPGETQYVLGGWTSLAWPWELHRGMGSQLRRWPPGQVGTLYSPGTAWLQAGTVQTQRAGPPGPGRGWPPQ